LPPETPDLVIILGPTAVGKSRTALGLAIKFRGEIINGDSVQVYMGFDIGTDKPSLEDRRMVPHHLFDVVAPDVQFTAADFVREALAAAAGIVGRGRVPFVVGGTGLYLKALVDGLFPGPGRDPALRAELEAEARDKGLETLFRRLEGIDPVYAQKVRSRDRVRIIRALEVWRLTGRPISEHFHRTASPSTGYRVIKVGLELERASLYRRIDERVERMFASGLLDEARGLLARGVGEDAPPFRALGYRQALACLRGELSLEEAKALTKTDTRHYAKRQMTWFRKMDGVAWFPADSGPALEQYLQILLE
jgi:tRNA dimethylallyltransferase